MVILTMVAARGRAQGLLAAVPLAYDGAVGTSGDQAWGRGARSWWMWAAVAAWGCGHAQGNQGPRAAGFGGQMRLEVTALGRFVPEPDGHLRFGWPNTALGMRFVGTGLSVCLYDVVARAVDGRPARNLYDVWVDGQRLPAPLRMAVGRREHEVVAGLGPGAHTVWLHKRTEGIVGNAVFCGAEPLGDQARALPPPPLSGRRIEVIGASNEAGYGVEASLPVGQTCAFSDETENANLAWPARLAAAFAADLVNIAFSGKGLTASFNKAPGTSATMPELYRRADPMDRTSNFAFDDPPPQLVVVTLGGNDFAGTGPSLGAFASAYADFLLEVHRRRPEAAILCLLGPTWPAELRASLQPLLEGALARARTAGLARGAVVALAPYAGPTFGCEGHPDRALQAAMAAELAPHVAALTGWDRP